MFKLNKNTYISKSLFKHSFFMLNLRNICVYFQPSIECQHVAMANGCYLYFFHLLPDLDGSVRNFLKYKFYSHPASKKLIRI